MIYNKTYVYRFKHIRIGNESVVAKWKMQIVPDQDHVNFQDSEEL